MAVEGGSQLEAKFYTYNGIFMILEQTYLSVEEISNDLCPDLFPLNRSAANDGHPSSWAIFRNAQEISRKVSIDFLQHFLDINWRLV